VTAGRLDDAHRLLATAGPFAHRLEVTLGDAAGPAIGALRFAEGQVELAEGDIDRARQKLARAVALVRIAGNPSLLVRTLTVLAQAELAAGNTQAARRALEEAGDIIDSEPVFPATLAALDDMQSRLDRAAADSARTEHRLLEDLTDRELAILRFLPGPLTQREIGRELYLSINTVKGYTKSLYRKLGVASRVAAVEQARKLGLV
jgi:LuxR family maltose regulon positive regulatory protein